MDRILINDLAARCVIGVADSERLEKQDVVINLSICTDMGRPGKTDRFEDAVDYRGIKKRVLALVEESHFYLLEALAEAVAEVCLENTAVTEVVVRVDKPSALRFARTVGVEITRRRAG